MNKKKKKTIFIIVLILVILLVLFLIFKNYDFKSVLLTKTMVEGVATSGSGGGMS